MTYFADVFSRGSVLRPVAIAIMGARPGMLKRLRDGGHGENRLIFRVIVAAFGGLARALQESRVRETQTAKFYRTFLDDAGPLIALKFAARTGNGALAWHALVQLAPQFFMAVRPNYQRLAIDQLSLLAHALDSPDLRDVIYEGIVINQYGRPFSGTFADEAQESNVVFPFKTFAANASSPETALLHGSQALVPNNSDKYVPGE